MCQPDRHVKIDPIDAVLFVPEALQKQAQKISWKHLNELRVMPDEWFNVKQAWAVYMPDNADLCVTSMRLD